MLSLTATELPRLMKCNGLRLLDKTPSVDTDRTLRDEGQAVDWLIKQVFRENFHAEELIDRKADNGVFITADMVDFSEEYLADIMGKGDIEVVTTHSDKMSYEIRGRTDHVSCDDSLNLYVSDFKYGWRIVEPFENWTLISHAIGWWLNNQSTVPERVIFTIYQPRPFHHEGSHRTWEISFTDLMDYWRDLDKILKNPSDMLFTGPHCYKCSSMTECPVSQTASMNSIDVAEMAFNSDVDNKQLSYIMDELKRANTVISQTEDAYNNLAMARVRNGEIVPNYCIETSMGNAEWKDGMTPNVVEMITGVDVAKKKLLTPNQAKKAGVSPEIIDSLCERKSRGFKLVRKDSNKRAEQLFGKK